MRPVLVMAFTLKDIIIWCIDWIQILPFWNKITWLSVDYRLIEFTPTQVWSGRPRGFFVFFSFSFFPSLVVSVSGQRCHAQLLPEPHQEVQVHKTFVRFHSACVNRLLTHVHYRPAVSATVRWPVLTPLKRKGTSFVCVCVLGCQAQIHFLTWIVKIYVVSQEGRSLMGPQRNFLLPG